MARSAPVFRGRAKDKIDQDGRPDRDDPGVEAVVGVVAIGAVLPDEEVGAGQMAQEQAEILGGHDGPGAVDQAIWPKLAQHRIAHAGGAGGIVHQHRHPGVDRDLDRRAKGAGRAVGRVLQQVMNGVARLFRVTASDPAIST